MKTLKTFLFTLLVLVAVNVIAQESKTTQKQATNSHVTTSSANKANVHATSASTSVHNSATTSNSTTTTTATSTATSSAQANNAHLKKDGTPDKRYKENAHVKKDGTPDKRYKENKGTTK